MPSPTASPVPDKNSESTEESSATDYGPMRPGENILDWSRRNQNAPPCRRRNPTPPGGPRNHGGPIRITSSNGVLTEYGKKLEQERLAKLAAGEDKTQVQLLEETHIINTGRLTNT